MREHFKGMSWGKRDEPQVSYESYEVFFVIVAYFGGQKGKTKINKKDKTKKSKSLFLMLKLCKFLKFITKAFADLPPSHHLDKLL